MCSLVYKLVHVFLLRFYKVTVLNPFQVQRCEDSMATETYLQDRDKEKRCEFLLKFDTF